MIYNVASDPEVQTFSHDIAAVFRRNGWPVLFNSTTSSLPYGVMIPLYEEPDLLACGIARMVFSDAGIDTVGGDPPKLMGLLTGSGDNITGPRAIIFIGSKPPPQLK